MSHAKSSLGKILVYRPQSEEGQRFVEALGRLGDVHVENTVRETMDALETGQFDVFVSGASEFAKSESLAANRRLAAVLDVIGQGVCVVDARGRLVWSNAKFEKLPHGVTDRIRQHCIDAQSVAGVPGPAHRARFLSLVIDAERFYDVAITPIEDQSGQPDGLVAVVSDVTRTRRLQQKMDAIDNAGRELVRVDVDQLAKMGVPQRLELLERKIIRYTRELLDFDNFAIRLVDKGSGKLELVLCAGLPAEAQQIDIYVSTENNGISGYVAATGRSYICPDIETDTRYVVGIDNARSSLTVPLRLHDNVIGVFNIESDRAGAFSEEDRQFAEIFGRYVAIALHILDVLVVERHATAGRLVDDVSAEIAGPLGDILGDASTLMEDYIGHDDLRHRLQTIIDNVVRIKDAVREVTCPADGILGSKPQQPEIDAVLSGKIVLVIDDEELIRQTVRDVLAKFGCEVETARDGTQAVALVRQRNYDLVVSDIRMPGKSGYEIFAAVKDEKPSCPVIFMTGFGYDPNHSIIRARQEGLAAVLYKPFKVDQLLTEVRHAISSSA